MLCWIFSLWGIALFNYKTRLPDLGFLIEHSVIFRLLLRSKCPRKKRCN